MAQNSKTPVSYWLSLPLSSFGRWIDANNRLIAERKNNAPPQIPVKVKPQRK